MKNRNKYELLFVGEDSSTSIFVILNEIEFGNWI